jgi:hypothetical protein
VALGRSGGALDGGGGALRRRDGAAAASSGLRVCVSVAWRHGAGAGEDCAAAGRGSEGTAVVRWLGETATLGNSARLAAAD